MIDSRLLEIVVCPDCRSALTPVPDAESATELRCTERGCGLRYPIRDGVPVLLVDEASGGHPAEGSADDGVDDRAEDSVDDGDADAAGNASDEGAERAD